MGLEKNTVKERGKTMPGYIMKHQASGEIGTVATPGEPEYVSENRRRINLISRDNKYLLFNSIISTPGNFNIFYPTAIHAFMSHMTVDFQQAISLMSLKPKDAYYLEYTDFGEKVDNINWEHKLGVMLFVQLSKFLSNSRFGCMLVDSVGPNHEDVEFVYENISCDNYWGSCVCNKCGGQGENWLGKILYEVRRECIKVYQNVDPKVAFGKDNIKPFKEKVNGQVFGFLDRPKFLPKE